MKETASWANAHHHESAAILARVLEAPADRIEAVPRAEYAVGISPGLIEPAIELCVKYGVIAQTVPRRRSHRSARALTRSRLAGRSIESSPSSASAPRTCRPATGSIMSIAATLMRTAPEPFDQRRALLRERQRFPGDEQLDRVSAPAQQVRRLAAPCDRRARIQLRDPGVLEKSRSTSGRLTAKNSRSKQLATELEPRAVERLLDEVADQSHRTAVRTPLVCQSRGSERRIRGIGARRRIEQREQQSRSRAAA